MCGDGSWSGLPMHQPCGCCISTQLPNPIQDERKPPKITQTSTIPPLPRRRPLIPVGRWGDGVAGPAPPPRGAGSGPFGGSGSQAHTGSQVRRAGPRASRRDVVFSHSTRAGPSGSETLKAFFPTLVAIKKCKFILLLPLLFLPACKTILGHNGPTEREPRRAWEPLGQGNTSWVGAGSTSSSNGLVAKEGQGSTQCPGEQERLLAGISPSVLRYPSQESLKVLAQGGKIPKNNPKPHT